jgi:O-methyltransferase
MLTKLKALLELPQAERNAKVRRGLRNRYEDYLSEIIYSTVGYWLNRTRSRYMLDYRPDSHYNLNRFGDYERLLNGWLAGNRTNCGDLSRFYAIYLNVNQVLTDDIPGEFVELGVYKGNSAILLATLARPAGRHVYLFDTFEGFDKRDFQGIDSKSHVGFADTSLAAVQEVVGIEGVTYVQGFFPESMSKVTMPDEIAVAHIDCDLYAPMKAGLEELYPRLSRGGIMLLHDHSSGRWPGATQAINEFFEHLPDKPILLPDKSGTAIVRKAMQ